MSSIYYGIGYAYDLSGVLLIVYFKSLASSDLSIFFFIKHCTIFFFPLKESHSFSSFSS